MNELQAKKILYFAVRAGEIMLQSGAETYRVEDTISRILQSRNFDTVETFVIPTAIIATIDNDGIELSTQVKRIKNRSTRLDKIALINTLSRQYVTNQISTEGALLQLEKINQSPTYRPLMIILATGATSAFFSVMCGGRMIEFISALLIGLFFGTVQQWLQSKKITSYFTYFVCGFIIGGSVVFSHWMVPSVNVSYVVTGSIMPLVPGVAFTNSIRDMIGDELLSGISRGVEALFIAICIAAGVGVAMSMFSSIGGLIL